jgi:hypothetical protein
VSPRGAVLAAFCRAHRDPYERVRGSGAYELPSLEDALQLVHLYAERESPKFEKAAMRWLDRYLSDGKPGFQHFAEITASLAKRGSTTET